VTVPVDDASADIVFLIETVEHLGDNVVDGILSETSRITKPGGYVVMTTPNDENLDESKIMCPDCGCVFHTYQHMRSWTPPSLSNYVLKYGFREVNCQPTLFSTLPYWMWLFYRLAYALLGRKLPHLLYIGQKAAGS
jgi:2-polyprenyl-3-methyl-5-hydroxy-6-metoxy-1,4-benzoquinol methylase